MDRSTDIGLKFETIALPVFNPYSGQCAGYSIAKGKLTTDLRYRIADRKLDARHRVRIDQLEWGEASANKGEATLPVKFATALLGALLGALFTGAEDAQFVDFAPGDAALEAATAERLAALSKGLVQKPAVSLGVPIGVVAGIDAPALRQRRHLEQRSAATVAFARRRAAADAAPPAFEALAPKQRREVLEALLKELGGAKVEVPPPTEPPEGSSRAEVRSRADAVQRALLTGSELEPSRVNRPSPPPVRA